jgi:hypothetical protein
VIQSSKLHGTPVAVVVTSSYRPAPTGTTAPPTPSGSCPAPG